jgi:hypothetical protein
MIRNVVFDIGWVFGHLNPKPIVDFLVAHDAPTRDLESETAGIALNDHECGRLHGHGLLERLAKLTRRPVSLAGLHKYWLDMFELQPAMVDLAHRLSLRHQVYLLSNIGDLHWAHLSREYRLHHIGHGVLPSRWSAELMRSVFAVIPATVLSWPQCLPDVHAAGARTCTNR